MSVRPLLMAAVALVMCGPAFAAEQVCESDPRIGTWDGQTQTAELAGPYEDVLQQQIPFGIHSYYLAPWRAYMDTWPASRFLELPGINFNVGDEELDAAAQVLAEAGIRSGRVEVGWGSMDYDDPTRLPDGAARRVSARLAALKAHGIRPLILLNANSGWPCPIKGTEAELLEDAAAGARAIRLGRTDFIRPHYTGLSGQAYQNCFPLIVSVDAQTGRCELSAPLQQPLKKGKLWLGTLKYHPFGGAVFEDGTPNPAAQETLAGWMGYVAAVCVLARQALGTEAAADAGFDLEVWNEYTFGSQFLDEGNYYAPPRKFKEQVKYTKRDLTRSSHEIILPMTVDYVNDPKNKLAGVEVIDGFANQRPWEHGSGMWPGQAGFSRHYYTGIDPARVISPKCESDRLKAIGPVNALGGVDGKRDGRDWHTIVPGTAFIPTHRMAMPEYWHYAYQTEFMTRDVQPFPGPWWEHHRFSILEGYQGLAHTAQVWMTETNTDRWQWASQLIKETGCAKDDPRLVQLMHHAGAKALLRMYVFYGHKGVHTINTYAAKGGDIGLGVIPDAFFTALKEAKGQLTDGVRAQVGPQLTALGRVTRLMKEGEPIETARPLGVAKLVEHEPRLVFKGDGTPEHPDRYHRDDFACLPFQLGAARFAVGYYVVTRDMAHAWDPERAPLDPARYDMPEQTFDLTLSNVRGDGAKVTAWDPLTDKGAPVEVLAASTKDITVRLAAVDYPRFLLISEAAPGPLILNPRFEFGKDRTVLTFDANVEGKAAVTWGPVPMRRGGNTFKGQYFDEISLTNLKLEREDECILFNWGNGSPDPSMGPDTFSVRWTGQVKPRFSELYTFYTVSDDGVRLWVNGTMVVDDWNDHGSREKTGTVDLKAGQLYDVKVEYYENGGGTAVSLMWSSPSQQKEVVRPTGENRNQKTLEATPGQKCCALLPAFKSNQGVRITLEAGSIAARWPVWDYDVQGQVKYAR